MKDINFVSSELQQLANRVEDDLAAEFARINRVQEQNEQKVLQAFRLHQISEGHLSESTGYGYGDRGRDALDSLFADVFDAEDALVRPHFVSGTHALTVALFGILRPGTDCLALPESRMTRWRKSSGCQVSPQVLSGSLGFYMNNWN